MRKNKSDLLENYWKELRWIWIFLGFFLTALCYLNINKSEVLPESFASVSWMFFGIPGAVLLVNGIVNWNNWLPKVPNQTKKNWGQSRLV